MMIGVILSYLNYTTEFTWLSYKLVLSRQKHYACAVFHHASKQILLFSYHTGKIKKTLVSLRLSLLPRPRSFPRPPSRFPAQRTPQTRRTVLSRLGGKHLQRSSGCRIHLLLRTALPTPGGSPGARQARAAEGAAEAGAEGGRTGAEVEQRRSREEVGEGGGQGSAAAIVAQVQEFGDAG